MVKRYSKKRYGRRTGNAGLGAAIGRAIANSGKYGERRAAKEAIWAQYAGGARGSGESISKYGSSSRTATPEQRLNRYAANFRGAGGFFQDLIGTAASSIHPLLGSAAKAIGLGTFLLYYK